MSKNKHLRSPWVLKLDRALSGGMGRQVFIYLLVVVVTFFALFGIALLFKIRLVSEKVPDAEFSDLWKMLFFFYDGGLEGTRPDNHWFVYLANILGSILMGGLLIAAITNYLLSNRDKAEKGLLRYRKKGHTVFIGCHEAMIPLVKNVLNRNESVVVLSELPFDEAKDFILSKLNEMPADRVEKLIVYHGFRTRLDDLESLCLNEARELFIFPSSMFQDSDSVNLDVVENISKKICNGGRKLKCTTVFQHNAVVACFERDDVDLKLTDKLDFTPVIYGDAVAQSLLSGKRLDRESITEDSDKFVHLFVLGLGEIGQAVFTQAVRRLHFPNYKKAKSRITLVGEQSEINAVKTSYREFFAVADKSEKYAYLGDFLDVSVNTILRDDMDGRDSAITEAVSNPDELVTIAICLEDSSEALRRAISFPWEVYDKSVPIWLYKPDSDSLVSLLRKEDNKGNKTFYSNISLFGDPENLSIDIDPKTMAIARRLFRLYHNSGDKQWDESDIKEKWSNINAACFIPTVLHSLCLREDEAERMNEMRLDTFYKVEHNRWVAATLLGGHRPPTSTERDEMVTRQGNEAFVEKAVKDDKKNNHFIHIDLCASEDIVLVHNGKDVVDVRKYDRANINNIPKLFQEQS